jgi:FKBP-type peptidyl-prolyl cis-trans isomerase (trigger factor)
MEWKRLDDDEGRSRLAIEAPWEEIAADYRDLVDRYAATARLPGFRPGKVPRGVIEQRFHREIVEDLSSQTAQRLGLAAVREAGVEALGSIEATEIACERGKPFRALVQFVPMPSIVVPEPSALVTADDGTDLRDRISRRLLELVPFEIQGELVRQELDRDGIGDTARDSEGWRAAEDRVRLLLILERIARREGMEVDERDVEHRIAEKAREFGESVKSLKVRLEQGGGIGRLREMLLAEATLDYLVEAVGRQTGEREAGR